MEIRDYLSIELNKNLNQIYIEDGNEYRTERTQEPKELTEESVSFGSASMFR